MKTTASTCIDSFVEICQSLCGGRKTSTDNGFLALKLPFFKPLVELLAGFWVSAKEHGSEAYAQDQIDQDVASGLGEEV